MIRTIVVPVDGSPASEAILPHVSELFRAADAEVRFVHVYDWSEAGFRRGRDYLKDLSRRVADRFPYAQTDLLKGETAFEILKYAVVNHADLIAMATHGSGVRKLFFGSTTLALMRLSQVPLFMTRPGSPARPIRKILVPLDGSKTSQGILPVVADLARGSGANVAFLTVVPRGPADPALKALKRVGTPFLKSGVPVESIVRPGEAVREILTTSRDEGADLIALGTHGRTGSDRFFFGSVAESVIRGATLPLILRRTPKTIAGRPRPAKSQPAVPISG